MEGSLHPFLDRPVNRRLTITAFLFAALALAFAAWGEWLARAADSAGESEIEERLQGIARGVEARIADLEASLERDLDPLQTELEAVSGPGASTGLFHALERQPIQEGRGWRIRSATGETLAWWGEQLPDRLVSPWGFDVASTWVIARREMASAGGLITVDRFARIPNRDARAALGIDPDWVEAARLHGGALRIDPPSYDFIVWQKGDHKLHVVLDPRPATEIASTLRNRTRSVVAILLSVALLACVIAIPADHPWRVASIASGIVLARIVLLGVNMTAADRVFNWSQFGSRFMGPLSGSPIDLMFTAATIAGLVVLLTRLSNPSTWMRASFLPVTLAFFFLVVRDVVENSRITVTTNHLLPTNPAQGLLLISLIILAGAVAELALHKDRAASVGAPLIAAAALFGIFWLALNLGSQLLWSIAAGALLVTFALAGHISWPPIRLAIRPVLITLLLYPALASFETSRVRAFVEHAWAPIVVTEGRQLTMMVNETLDRQFRSIDLETILPDGVDRTELRDLAHTLWLHSDLSQWSIPSSIIIFDLDGNPVSRFGVGLPEIREHTTHSRETITIGSIERNVIHKDYALVDGERVVAELTVYVANPEEPGVSAFTDIYRDLLRPGEQRLDNPLTVSIRPAMFDSKGEAIGLTSVRLPRSSTFYLGKLADGDSEWIEPVSSGRTAFHLRRGEGVLYVFPVELPGWNDHFRRAGVVAIWSALLVLLIVAVVRRGELVDYLRGFPAQLGFHARTSLYLGGAVLIPLLLFVILIRAYLQDRLESEYLRRGEAALSAGQRVIIDYLASAPGDPEEVMDDEIMTWLARVVGYELHLFDDDAVLASSRRDLFSSGIESGVLPGHVYSRVVLEGAQLVLERKDFDGKTFVEIYSPLHLAPGRSYTVALPFVVQAREIEDEVGNLATTTYLILAVITLVALVAAYRVSRTVMRPVQGLVAGARAVATGNFDVTVSPPEDPDLRLLVTTFTDMAKAIRKQQEALRYERDRLRTLLENIDAGVVVIDESMAISATNAASRRLFDIPDDEPGTFSPPVPEIRELLSNHLSGAAASIEVRLEIEETTRTIRISIVPLPGESARMLIAEDVTDILRSNRLEAWAEMARQIAHEIKNPLTPIQLTAEHMKAVADRKDPNLSRVVSDGTENILRQVATLRETSRDFSDFASLRAVEKSPIPFESFIRRLVGGYVTSPADGVQVQLLIEDSTPDIVEGDERMLRGAVSNLIENSLQAVGPTGTVEIRTSATSDSLIITVSDDGPGVEADQLPRVFEPHFSTKSFGTGLGLAIARKCVEDHGGTVHAENTESGFCVTIGIPL